MANVPNQLLNMLELLVPWELPLDQHLAKNERSRVDQALQQLLKALAESSPRQSLRMINDALTDLGDIETQVADIESTKTSLKTWEVEDYDRYFQVNHVHTPQTAICLVKGLLITCQQFMEICLQIPELDAQQVQLQKQGFVSYIHLLLRTFDLDKPESL
ncbi:MAG: hypothetical protein AAGH78_18155 [Cyanobacteria bacterium P01_H01_bin.58]